MDVSISKEFIKVYEQIAKLQNDITLVAKDCYDASIMSCDDISNATEIDYLTQQDADSIYLKKHDAEEQLCDIPTIFKELRANTTADDDSSTNVATTEFVHSVVSKGSDNAISCIVSRINTSNFVTQDQLRESIAQVETQCDETTDIEQLNDTVGQLEHNIEDLDKKIDDSIDELSQAVQDIQVPTKTSDLLNDSGFITINEVPGDLVTSVNGLTGNVLIDIPTVPEIPTNISAFTNDVGYITNAGVTSVNNLTGSVMVQENVLANWSSTSGLSAILNKPALKRVATTGDYNDLDNLPNIPVVPTDVSAFTNDVGYLTQHQDVSLKYDKTGGVISGDVRVNGYLSLGIEDQDYDSRILFNPALNTNLGTILTLQGKADDTNYKVVLRNIANPNQDYDAANKKYVDENIVRPLSYFVFLNLDGTIDTYSSQLKYSAVKGNLTNLTTSIYLDVIQGTSRFYVSAVQDMDTNNGPIKFIGIYSKDNNDCLIEFNLYSDDTLTVLITLLESLWHKVTSVVNNLSDINYPTTNAVNNEFQRKPVVLYLYESGTKITGQQKNINATNLDWSTNAITGIDFSPYKRLKFYITAGISSSNITPTAIVEVPLDELGAYLVNDVPYYTAGAVLPYINNDNRLYTVSIAVNNTKDSAIILRLTSLYGTAGTSAVDTTRYLYKIEGYFD